MKYLFSIVILSACVFSIGSTAPITSSPNSSLGPGTKVPDSTACYDCDGKYTGHGNICNAGSGTCNANPCPGCNQ